MKRMRRYVVTTRRWSDPSRTRLSFTLPLLAFFALVLGQTMLLSATDSLNLELFLPRVLQAMFLCGLLSVVLARYRK